MAKIEVALKNTTSDDQVVHGYDLFAQSKREVDGSPFALSPGERSLFFAINATDGRGTIGYRCDNGPSLTNIDVADGDVVEVG